MKKVIFEKNLFSRIRPFQLYLFLEGIKKTNGKWKKWVTVDKTICCVIITEHNRIRDLIRSLYSPTWIEYEMKSTHSVQIRRNKDQKKFYIRIFSIQWKLSRILWYFTQSITVLMLILKMYNLVWTAACKLGEKRHSTNFFQLSSTHFVSLLYFSQFSGCREMQNWSKCKIGWVI